jgi:uncharacterized protein (DUF1697 family)
MEAMSRLIALLRAVNVGGTGRLAMKDLASLCSACGFSEVRTYIQTGNVIFQSRLSAEKAGAALEHALAKHLGARVDVIMRKSDDLRDVLQHNPFSGAEPAKVAVFFARNQLRPADFDGATGVAGEQVSVGGRELYVHFPQGQGRSKLKLPKSLGVATARNLNTVRKLVEMCAD